LAATSPFRGGFFVVAVLLATPATAQEKQPPYWASIASGEAMTRTGPGKNYPGVWLYKRRDLPVRVVKKYEHWRLIEDPDGARGWMLVTLLSDRRTAIVKPGDPRPVRVQPNDGATVRYLAEHGVVGRIDQCGNGWCRIEIGRRRGYIQSSDIWGVGTNETID
jgi:SH3-like domain-containing protein